MIHMSFAAKKRADQPNLLIWGLVLISALFHIFLLARFAGLHRAEHTSYIEVEMKSPVRKARSNPNPPARRRFSPPAPAPRTAPVEKVNPVTPPSAPAVATSPSRTLVTPAPVPDRPKIPKDRSVKWSPPVRASSPAPAAMKTSVASAAPAAAHSVKGSGGDSKSGDNEGDEDGVSDGGADNYFNLIRAMIEKQKKYPYSARKRRIQGRVVVRLIIDSDGGLHGLNLVKKAESDILNRAALDAVRRAAPFPGPPKSLRSGPVRLEVPIVFNLT